MKDRPRLWAARFGAVSLCLVWSITASAQTSLQIPLQFDFINPGAKSLALAGAFVGLADDSTATFANPAGLTQRLRPEFSFDIRGTRATSLFLQRGRLSGAIIGEGTDTIQGPVFGESIGSHLGAGYLSLVYPSKSRQWVVAAYRHELAHVEQTFLSEGVFQKDPTEFTSRRDSPQEAVRSVAITGYGVSVAHRVRPSVSVGAGLVLYTFSIDSVFRRFDVTGFLGPPNLDVEFGRSTQKGDDIGVAPVFGLTVDRGRARLGVVYRRGASFQFTTEDGNDPLRETTFRVPHTFAVGASMRVNRAVIVAGEVTWIGYGRLVEDFVLDQARATGREASFSIDNGTEVHLGVQYAFWRKDQNGDEAGAPIRLRVGTWYDPDHSVHFTAGPTPTAVVDRLFDERLSAALSQGADQWHVAGGIGLTMTSRLEFNAGLDVAPQNLTVSTSLVVHLGKEVLP